MPGLDWTRIQLLGHQLDWTGLGSVARGFGLDWIFSTQSISYSGGDPVSKKVHLCTTGAIQYGRAFGSRSGFLKTERGSLMPIRGPLCTTEGSAAWKGPLFPHSGLLEPRGSFSPEWDPIVYNRWPHILVSKVGYLELRLEPCSPERKPSGAWESLKRGMVPWFPKLAHYPRPAGGCLNTHTPDVFCRAVRTTVPQLSWKC